ncbi:MAG: hypothetical protein MJZ98_01030 [Paludibacteraceae bacterium]|nr:hypothetical protein [Paludibacteraceae bacterium]
MAVTVKKHAKSAKNKWLKIRNLSGPKNFFVSKSNFLPPKCWSVRKIGGIFAVEFWLIFIVFKNITNMKKIALFFAAAAMTVAFAACGNKAETTEEATEEVVEEVVEEPVVEEVAEVAEEAAEVAEEVAE